MLLAQFSSFPVNGADLYEELKNSTAILSTGCKRQGEAFLPRTDNPLGKRDENGATGMSISEMCLSLHCCSLDKLLDSGLYTGEVTEIMGASGSGKTQVGPSV